ncbi:MAG: malectin domain-containing carbohydrate-binding protein, partial [Ginsengibacter sp.]
VQIPWSRDSVRYNANHDSLKIRIHNKGIGTLTVNKLSISDDLLWKVDRLNGISYIPGSGLPLNVISGNSVELIVKFIAKDQSTRVKILHETLNIFSNDDKFPIKTVFLDGLWQREGEGDNEPYAREILEAFGFTTNVGFSHTDPDIGDSTKLKGDEIKPSYFVRADTTLPVTIIQMGSYHGCCYFGEKIMWNPKGTSTLNTVFTNLNSDAQTLLPRKGTPSVGSAGSFIPTGPFAFKIGSLDWTDAKKNPGYKIGIRVWKVYDPVGNIVPNAYIISNDYLGSPATNYDYNDDTYYIENLKPEIGSAYFSALNVTPSALDFNEKILQSFNTLTLNIKSLGQVYADGSQDPALNISSIEVVGENSSEFSASMPAKTTLNPQEISTLTVSFIPITQGFKNADLLVHYNNSSIPLRIPLYGIAEALGTTVTANFRINSGSSSPVTINGKTWSPDNQYSFDNLEPYTNSNVKQIGGTDEDVLYLKEQSSDGDKKPFRYEFPVTNGNYVVRLHFAEIYWGAPGNGSGGGVGSRVMSVKLENQLGLINFDVTDEVGRANAIIKNFPVSVSDGKLNIDFSASANRPMVCAIEIYSFNNSAPITKKTLNDSILNKTSNSLNLSLDKNNLGKAKAYPNPLHNNFTVEIPGRFHGHYKMQIIDITGRIYMLSEPMVYPGQSSRINVDISKLALKPGVYFLSVNSEGKKADVIKLIVE